MFLYYLFLMNNIKTNIEEFIFYPEIWGPHYWFFLHTVAMCYPITPNKVTKKKYYDFIINFPLFIPIPDIAKQFSEILDKYPVTPYLDSRESFIKWTVFIHNKINILLNKTTLDYNEFINIYINKFKNPKIKNIKNNIRKKYIIYLLIVIILLLLIFLILYS
jgi:hypothetical protein